MRRRRDALLSSDTRQRDPAEVLINSGPVETGHRQVVTQRLPSCKSRSNTGSYQIRDPLLLHANLAGQSLKAGQRNVLEQLRLRPIERQSLLGQILDGRDE